MGIDSSMTARPTSPLTRIRRRGRRSTQTPAGSVKSRNGRNSSVPRSATWIGGTCSTSTAMNGIAIWLTCVPRSEIVAAVHSFAKSALRNRLGLAALADMPRIVPTCHSSSVAGLVESVPNFSEGRRLDVVEHLAAAVESVPGAHLLDRTSDASHNRSVLTIAGEGEAVTEALERAVAVAVNEIDMDAHTGEHP